eukprot:jgi/Bigna1/86476/estExt_fgenesh1_pg.C_100333
MVILLLLLLLLLLQLLLLLLLTVGYPKTMLQDRAPRSRFQDILVVYSAMRDDNAAEHLSRDADGIEKVLYGQVLSEEELLARDETLKKHKKIAPDSPLRQVSVDVSDLEALQSETAADVHVSESRAFINTTIFRSLSTGVEGFEERHHLNALRHADAILGNLHTGRYIYPTKTGVPSEVASQFILSEVDGDYLKILSKDRGERPLICEQGPGDVIFVPEYWPYARISTSDAVVFSKHARHTPIQPQKTDRLEEFKELSEKYPNVHQFHVDIALSLIKENPKDCIKHMEMALEVGKYNMALRWQVARLLSRIGAKGPALSIASESIKLLTEASGAQSLTAKEKEADDEEKEGGEEEEDGGALFGEVSASIAKIHWSKFGQLLLYDLNMPLEAIVCFQMRLQITPNDINTIMLTARALTMLGAIREARVALEDALESDPDHKQAKKMLEELDSDEAKNLAETMKAMKGGDGNKDKFTMDALKAMIDESSSIVEVGEWPLTQARPEQEEQASIAGVLANRRRLLDQLKQQFLVSIVIIIAVFVMQAMSSAKEMCISYANKMDVQIHIWPTVQSKLASSCEA